MLLLNSLAFKLQTPSAIAYAGSPLLPTTCSLGDLADFTRSGAAFPSPYKFLRDVGGYYTVKKSFYFLPNPRHPEKKHRDQDHQMAPSFLIIQRPLNSGSRSCVSLSPSTDFRFWARSTFWRGVVALNALNKSRADMHQCNTRSIPQAVEAPLLQGYNVVLSVFIGCGSRI